MGRRDIVNPDGADQALVEIHAENKGVGIKIDFVDEHVALDRKDIGRGIGLAAKPRDVLHILQIFNAAILNPIQQIEEFCRVRRHRTYRLCH